MEESFAPLEDQVRRIHALCQRRVSGTVVLLSDDNRMAQLHLRDGQIVFVLCRGRRGAAALEQLRALRSVRMRLDGAVEYGASPEMPPTDTILAYLSGAFASLPGYAPDTLLSAAAPGPRAQQAAAVQPAAPMSAPVSAPASAPRQPGGVTPAVREALRLLLARYIGPMAQIVFGEHDAASTDALTLIASLMGEIDEPDQASRFKQEAQALLAK